MRRSIEYEKLDKQTKFRIWLRDEGKCIICNEPADDIHEIIPRSQFGNLKIEKLFSEKNRCCICRKHHNNTVSTRLYIMNKLEENYNYNYNEYPWERYKLMIEESKNGEE